MFFYLSILELFFGMYQIPFEIDIYVWILKGKGNRNNQRDDHNRNKLLILQKSF